MTIKLIVAEIRLRAIEEKYAEGLLVLENLSMVDVQTPLSAGEQHQRMVDLSGHKQNRKLVKIDMARQMRLKQQIIGLKAQLKLLALK